MQMPRYTNAQIVLDQDIIPLVVIKKTTLNVLTRNVMEL